MQYQNFSKTTDFFLEGITDVPDLQIPLFLVFVLMYLLTLMGNLLIIFVVCLEPLLHNPMYFFLCNLAFLDITYSSITQPNLLALLLKQHRISFMGCIMQLYIFLALASTEFLSLTAMAYDRYVAICNPLQYLMIMNKRVCILLTTTSWMIGFVDPAAHTVLIAHLRYCGSHVINHFYCDVSVLLKLSCEDTSFIEFMSYIVGSLLGLPAFLLTMVTYICIISTILKIHSTKGRQKAFSTCASHLTVVILFYGTLLIVYMRPTSYYSPTQAKYISVLYTTFIPLCNPLIYTLRNNDVKKALQKMWARK